MTDNTSTPYYGVTTSVSRLVMSTENGDPETGVDTWWVTDDGGDILRVMMSNLTNSSVAAGVTFSLQFSVEVTVVLIALMALTSILTTCGNIIVIIAFISDEKLRTVSNYYILNLAIADLLIGCIAMPLYIPYIILGAWPLGHGLCLFWLVVDFVICSASVLNIMAISLDRYLSVTKAVDYRLTQSRRTAMRKMVIVWVVAFFLYGPATVLWEHFDDRNISDTECSPEFHYNFYFTLSAAVVEFFMPLTSVSFFNFQIYLNIQRRSQKAQRISSTLSNSSTTSTKYSESSSDTSKSAKTNCNGEGSSAPNSTIRFLQQRDKEKHLISLRRDKRAAKALAIIVGVFSVCWAPYTLLTLIRALCPECVDAILFECAFWMLWLNSTVNPLLYPFCHPQFRKSFHKLLCERGCFKSCHSPYRAVRNNFPRCKEATAGTCTITQNHGGSSRKTPAHRITEV